MLRNVRRFGLFSAVVTMICALLAAPGSATAQGADDRVVDRLVALGNRRDTAATRRLADSVLAGVVSPAAQAEALYWRGLFAAPRGSGRADLLRITLDHPSLARAGDAQFALAIEDLGAGNRSGALTRLARVVRDHAGSTNGVDAAARLGQLLLDDGDLSGGCAAFDSALAYLPAESVERRNQVNYARRPCERLAEQTARDSTAMPTVVPPTVAQPPSATPPPRTARRPTTPVAATRWSAQVAAHTNRADADRMAERLKARGFDVRVTGETPYRVRIGRYAVRSEAVALVGRLKAEGTNAILVEAERR